MATHETTARDYITHAADRIPTGLDRPTKRWLQSFASSETKRIYARALGLVSPTDHTARTAGLGWLIWCRDHNIDAATAEREDVADWLDDLRTRQLAKSTRAAMLSAVCSWYQWMRSHESPPPVHANPAAAIDRRLAGLIRTRDTQRSIALSDEQARAMMAAATADVPDTVSPYRSAALIAVLLGTGARAAEIATATTDSIAHTDGTPGIWLCGKGAVERQVNLPAEAMQHLRRYLTDRHVDIDDPPGEPEPLFTSARGSALHTHEIRRTVKRIAVNGGPGIARVAHLVHTHTLRHTFATRLLKERVPLHQVQRLLGHSNPKTTQLYDHTPASAGARTAADLMGEVLTLPTPEPDPDELAA